MRVNAPKGQPKSGREQKGQDHVGRLGSVTKPYFEPREAQPLSLLG